MSAPVVATPVSSRAAPQLSAIAVAVALAFVAGVSLMALMVWNLGSADNSQAVEIQSYAAGYPLHGGLAGPSQLATRERESYAAGYPLHGGLAGPSQLATRERGATPRATHCTAASPGRASWRRGAERANSGPTRHRTAVARSGRRSS